MPSQLDHYYITFQLNIEGEYLITRSKRCAVVMIDRKCPLNTPYRITDYLSKSTKKLLNFSWPSNNFTRLVLIFYPAFPSLSLGPSFLFSILFFLFQGFSVRPLKLCIDVVFVLFGQKPSLKLLLESHHRTNFYGLCNLIPSGFQKVKVIYVR